MIDQARERLIFALDVDSFDKAQEWVGQLSGKVGLFKIGKQLFTRCGPEVVKMVRDAGGEVFLDMKYHDIPNTVAKAGVEATRLGAKIYNLHALGGLEMMKKMVEETDAEIAASGVAQPVRLAVTILTSSTEETLRGIGVDHTVPDMVRRLALLAKEAGMEGVVASPMEISLIREACGDDFVIVTPGVRPASASLDDQKRVMTPGEAIAKGADYLVVGRPISAAPDPAAAADAIVEEMAAALKARS